MLCVSLTRLAGAHSLTPPSQFDSSTALDYARQHGQKEIVQLLTAPGTPVVWTAAEAKVQAEAKVALKTRTLGPESLTAQDISVILKQLELSSMVEVLAGDAISGADISDCANSDVFAALVPSVSALQAK